MNHLKAVLSAPILLILIVSPAVVRAQPNARVVIPPTPAGKQLTDWLGVFGRGRQDEFRRFIGERYSEALLKEDTAHDRADRQSRSFLDTRGHKLRSIEKSTPDEIVVLTQAMLTDLWFRLTVKVDAANKITQYSSQRIAPPIVIRSDERDLPRDVEVFMAKLAAADAFSGVVLVAKDGTPIFKRAYGLASKAYNFPNRIDTKLNIASATKMFTAVAVAQLIEKGKLTLNDTVANILPDYPNKEVAKKITVHHLLSHSSGLGDYHGAGYICRKGVLRTPHDYFPLLADQKLSFEPGEKMQYSNAGYVILGAIIEKVSGESYFDYVNRHIFKVAGMTATGFYETDIDTPNLATGYTNFEDKGDDYFEFHLGERRNTSLYNGAKGSSQGGAFSTADDLLRFCLALRAGKLLSAKSVDLLTSKKYFFRKYAASDISYGYGFEVEEVGGKLAIGHGGGDLGISSALRWFPESGYTVVILSNYDRGGIVADDKLKDLIMRTRP
ncbi:MAG TPA: serine hydrolase domain-containing protein [Pyrinomonadaceae bacterium]|nr:serine hydrolase domain-containing protein [Pyrinomonadaceae bacterium]